MFGLTALELARIQFGFTISFHIVFPAITIGLPLFRGPGESRLLRLLTQPFRDERNQTS